MSSFQTKCFHHYTKKRHRNHFTFWLKYVMVNLNDFLLVLISEGRLWTHLLFVQTRMKTTGLAYNGLQWRHRFSYCPLATWWDNSRALWHSADVCIAQGLPQFHRGKSNSCSLSAKQHFLRESHWKGYMGYNFRLELALLSDVILHHHGTSEKFQKHLYFGKRLDTLQN